MAYRYDHRTAATRLQWRRVPAGSDTQFWVAEHEGEKFTIQATRNRAGDVGNREYYWTWKILVRPVEAPMTQAKVLKKPGLASYSGFRTLAKMVSDYLDGKLVMERVPNRHI